MGLLVLLQLVGSRELFRAHVALVGEAVVHYQDVILQLVLPVII